MHQKNTIQPETSMTITQKIRALQQPAAYPHPVGTIETKETHLSWVFLAGDFAYKLKKPVQNHVIDLRTLPSRFNNCRQEIRLNKKLAKEIYLGMEPLVASEEGSCKIGGKGKITDWLVKMKRIREKDLLDYQILHHQTDPQAIEQAAGLLAKFYHSLLPVAVTTEQYTRKLEQEIIFIHDQLLEPEYELPPDQVGQIQTALLSFLRTRGPVFDQRVRDGRIMEVHGDLRPEHICLSPGTAIIDTLEFSRELRTMDVAEELSFLDMECEMMGDGQTGKIFFATHRKVNDDEVPAELILFYKAKKAFLRAFLVARHIKEAGYRGQSSWIKKANAYLQLTRNYLRLLQGSACF